MFRAIQRALDRIVTLSTVLGGVSVALMMLHVTIDVVAKFVFQSPLPGTISIVSGYYMVVVTFLCIAVAERERSHIVVEIVYDILPRRIQRILYRFGTLVSAVIFGFLTWQGFISAEAKRMVGAFETENAVKILIWPSYYLVPIGALLMTVVLVVKLVSPIAPEDGQAAAPTSEG